MSTSSALREAAVPAGETSALAMAYRHRGVLRVTVVGKASFTFAPDAPMPRARPQPVFRTEVHEGNHPARSIRFTPDRAPYLGRADVLLSGHAHPPPGAGESFHVRLGVFDGPRAVLDKTVVVRDHRGAKVPLVYERAFGGMGMPSNPLGTGAKADEPAPNLIDPRDPKRVACFAPIGGAWPERKKLLGALAKKALDEPIVELPPDFDWSYFQAAPVDQRVDYLRGDEWIVMDGLHPTLARLRLRLPGARAIARIHGLAPAGIEEGQSLSLHADTLRIDADAELVTLSFRGTFPIPDESALEPMRVVVGVELPGHPIVWPDPASLSLPSGGSHSTQAGSASISSTLPPSMEQFESVHGDVRAGTLALDFDDPKSLPASSAALPFQDAGAFSPLRQPSTRTPIRRQSSPFGRTVVSQDAPIDVHSILPFGAKRPAPEPAAGPPTPASPPAPAPAASEPKRTGSPWKEPAPAPAAARPPPPPPKPAGPPPASPALKRALYGRFGGKT